MVGIVFSTFMNHLLGSATVDGIENIPLPHAFQRIIAGQHAFDPKINKTTSALIYPSWPKMFAPHSSSAFFTGDYFLRCTPGGSIVV